MYFPRGMGRVGDKLDDREYDLLGDASGDRFPYPEL